MWYKSNINVSNVTVMNINVYKCVLLIICDYISACMLQHKEIILLILNSSFQKEYYYISMMVC